MPPRKRLQLVTSESKTFHNILHILCISRRKVLALNDHVSLRPLYLLSIRVDTNYSTILDSRMIQKVTLQLGSNHLKAFVFDKLFDLASNKDVAVLINLANLTSTEPTIG